MRRPSAGNRAEEFEGVKLPASVGVVSQLITRSHNRGRCQSSADHPCGPQHAQLAEGKVKQAGGVSQQRRRDKSGDEKEEFHATGQNRRARSEPIGQDVALRTDRLTLILLAPADRVMRKKAPDSRKAAHSIQGQKMSRARGGEAGSGAGDPSSENPVARATLSWVYAKCTGRITDKP
jgi:hypothetical protein